MIHNIKLKTGETVQDTLTNLIKKIHDIKSPEQPGKVVIQDTKGKVVKVTTVTGLESNVEHSFAEQLDVNRMLDPVMKKGLLRHVTKFEGQLDDFPAEDFQTAMEVIAKTKSQFEELPSQLRKEFKSPQGMLEFVQNPANRGRLRELGMLKALDGVDAKGANTGYNPEAEIKTEDAAKLAAATD